MDITKWSILKSDWLYSLQPKMEKLFTVSQNKTWSWLWLWSSAPYCKMQAKLKEVEKTTRPSSSVQFSHSVISNSLWPLRLKHARLPCPSKTPGGCSSSCPLMMPSNHLILCCPFKYDWNQISYDYTVEVTNRLKGLDRIECLKKYGQRFITLYRRQWPKPSQRKRNARRPSGYLRGLCK